MTDTAVIEAQTVDAAAVAADIATVPAPAGQPWLKSWFYCAPGEWATLVWVILIHATGPAGLVLTACGVIPLPPWPIVVAAVALLFLGGLGTTVCYHRSLTHRGLVLSPLVEHVLIFFAMLNGSGRPLTWVANHRLHHATSDRAGDISSPLQGFWWAHLRWLWQAEQGTPERFCKDLTAPRYRIWGRMQVEVLALSFFGGLMCANFGGWQQVITAWLWLGPLRLLWALHTQCTVNSVCHLGTVTPEHDSSLNVWWLALVHLGHGENWHANHHNKQVDPRLGQRWWQLDLGWWAILGLAQVKLARKIRRPGADSE